MFATDPIAVIEISCLKKNARLRRAGGRLRSGSCQLLHDVSGFAFLGEDPRRDAGEDSALRGRDSRVAGLWV